jgi:hypothetical protein
MLPILRRLQLKRPLSGPLLRWPLLLRRLI